MVEVYDLGALVILTYGRPYDFQQQEGCRVRGVFEISVPVLYPEDFHRESIKEKVNGAEMGVSFSAWLARDPQQKLDSEDEWERKNGLNLFWHRNFYPSLDMIVNDLYAKGLIEAGDYCINIDW